MKEYQWEAVLKDGRVIKQSTDVTKNSFKEVIDNKEFLSIFQICSQDGQERTYSVNMNTGEFNLNGFIIKSSIDLSNETRKEPIYWERSKVVYSSEDGGHAPVVVGFIIGWQVNIEGKNFQQQFMITPTGEVILQHKV